ncbi:MAG: hypothetical protein Kapaf2KO_10590 [Candidatus Kapaibacteriales bacterium]
MLKNIIILLLLFSLISCDDEEFPFDESGLTYKGKFVYDNQFLINGMYIEKPISEPNAQVSYFFSNGSYYSAYTENFKESDFCHNIPDGSGDVPYLWGFYIIEGDLIKIQLLDPGSRVRYSEFKVMERWGTIINDSTIQFFKEITTDNKEKDYRKIFSFRECVNKPDSNNILLNF